MIAQVVDGLIGEAVELAGLGVTLDLAIEAIGLERLEPSAEFRVLVGWQGGDGFLKVFDAHNANIICDFSHSDESTNVNIRCRNCKNPPRTRSNSAAPRSSNRVHPLAPDEEHANANVREIGFSRRRLRAGPRRRSPGASRRHGLSRGAGRLPGAAARLLRAAAGGAGLLPAAAAAARRVWLSAAAARRIRHLRRAALRRRAGTVLRAGAVLARLRTSLCLWLLALARLSALGKSPRRVG